MNLLSVHPLWLTSSSVSGNTLREAMVDYGLGAITNCLNRMSYFGPMIFDLVTSIWRLGVLNISIASTFVFLLGILHFHIFLPYSDHYSKIRDEIVRGKRKRFTIIEKIEYSNLQKCRTRSFQEYEASVDRINRYREYFNQITLDADFNVALIASLSDVTKEFVGFALIFWVIYQNDEFSSMINSQPPTTTLIVVLVISMRNIVKSFSQVLDHKNYLKRELTEFQPLAGLLQTTFTSQEISQTGNQDYDESLLQEQISILRKIQQTSCSLHCPRIDIHEAYVTSLPTHRLHFALLEKKLSMHGGDIVFVSGANGTGKSLFFHGLAGRLDSPMSEGIFCPKLRKIGYGNACFNASYHDQMTSQEILPSSNLTFTSLSRAGFICEENQAVASINLGKGGGGGGGGGAAVTIGDILFRINGLLTDCTSEDYSLRCGNTPQLMISSLVEVLTAVSLFDRLLSQHFSSSCLCTGGDSREIFTSPSSSLNDQSEINEIYKRLCQTPLTGLSGGEQQRLRLASLFLLERIRFDVMTGTLPKSVLGNLETQPMQLLLLDEPDHHIDSNFLSIVSLLMQTLHPNHLRNLIVMIIMHKEVASLQSLQFIFNFQKQKNYFPKLRCLRMESILDSSMLPSVAASPSPRAAASLDDQDREKILLRYPLCEKAFEQYEKILEENNHHHQQNEKLNTKTTLSISLLKEIEI